MGLSIVAFALAGALGPPAPQTRGYETGDVRAFLRDLYAHYPTARSTPAFDPIGRSSGDVFDPAFNALLGRAERAAPKDEVGVIDGDPICDCQDDAGLTAKVREVARRDLRHANAVVDLEFAGPRPPDRRRLTFDLVLVGGHWRISDIHTQDTPSLRGLLRQSIEDARGRRRERR